MSDLLLPPPYPPTQPLWCWRLALVLVLGAGGWRWCGCLVLAGRCWSWCWCWWLSCYWCLVLAAGAGAWGWRVALVLVPGAGVTALELVLVLAASAGAGAWCWRLALVLVRGAGAGAWCWRLMLVPGAGMTALKLVLVLAPSAGTYAWCWRLALALLVLVLAAGADARAWCWRLALVLVPGAGAGAGAWCWRLMLVPGAGVTALELVMVLAAGAGTCACWCLVLAAGAGAGAGAGVSCWRDGAGGVSAGGVAAGGVSVGGVSAGGVAAGGVSAGGVSVGGVSAGGVSVDGVAAGRVSVGGVSAGGDAAGGGAAGGVAAGGSACLLAGGLVDLGAGGAGAGGAGACGTGVGGTVQRRPFFVSLPPSSLLPLGSVLRQCSEHASRPASPVCAVCTGHRVPRPRPPPVPGTHIMALRPSSVPLRVPLPSPPASSLADGPDPESDLVRAASLTITCLLTTIVTETSFESAAVSALVGELVDFAAACRLDYAASLFAESGPDCPPFVGAAVPHLVAMLLAPEGDPDAADIPTPRSYAEAVTSPYSSQWRTAMDAKMASWNLRRPVYDLRQVPRQWHDTLRTSLAALGFAPSSTDPSLFCAPTLRCRRSTSSCHPGQSAAHHHPVVLTGHVDASWIDDLATQRSSQGYTFSLVSGSVSWRSTRSSSVLSSSCEAEIYAGAMAAQELRWLTYLLTDLGERPRSPPILYVDNKAMIALC
ncbi:unnamed protein product [Closterium sp. NIES-53]